MQEAKRGDRVSLNVQKRLFYFQGQGGVNLQYGEVEVTVIPKEATDMQLKQINHDIQAGHLVLGWIDKQVDVPDKDSDLKKIADSGRNKVNDWILSVRDDKSITNEVKINKLEKLSQFEKSGRNRVSVLSVIEKALEKIGGVSTVEEDANPEKVEIELTKGTDEPTKP